MTRQRPPFLALVSLAALVVAVVTFFLRVWDVTWTALAVHWLTGAIVLIRDRSRRKAPPSEDEDTAEESDQSTE